MVTPIPLAITAPANYTGAQQAQRRWVDADGITWREDWFHLDHLGWTTTYGVFCPHPGRPGDPYSDLLNEVGLPLNETHALVARHLERVHDRQEGLW